MASFPPSGLQYKLSIINYQKERQSKIALWRSSVVIGCVLSLGFFATSPWWKVKERSQIKIEGNQLIESETIYDALDFHFPQPVWALKTTRMTRKLESISSIAAVNINRQVIPPKLIISIKERTPQAIATFDNEMGFLDAEGLWISRKFYTSIDHNFTLPKLIVHNYQPSYRKSWINLYKLISLYPELKVNQVQWNQSGNLHLETKIGKVILGTNPSQLEKQFETMLKLQNLSDRVDPNQISHIDLSSPGVNLIQKY